MDITNALYGGYTDKDQEYKCHNYVHLIIDLHICLSK